MENHKNPAWVTEANEKDSKLWNELQLLVKEHNLNLIANELYPPYLGIKTTFNGLTEKQRDIILQTYEDRYEQEE